MKTKRDKESIKQEVIDLIIEHLNVEEKNIKMNSSFTEDFGADSLDIVELTMAIEEDFCIEIPEKEMEAIKTVKELVDYILSRVES